ncbi:head-tail connector protein [Limosilactobacillus reuteri]|uniref:head-tail connector protein n=1 Tax=Limosilactobacillus reuteri TaxID=1598 RepID=UPI001C0DE7B7|nr:head-tail connector protein [Limosilactobacillus reuteri]QWS04626.1 phage gp6-like head-tail connector protein [Limosilactobacillus reuteri]QWS04910.1 phage gp6-like head-tail connector protein [Limosilactobacillus reuteri]
MEDSNLPEVSVDSIKDALRIDGSQDDLMIQSYIDTAKDYVASAITNSSDIDFMKLKKYRLAVILLVQFWYSNRTTDMKQTPYQVVSLIQQLRGELW